MTALLVAGLINVETTLAVDDFPIEYTPVRYPFFGVSSTVAGVGFNVAAGLARWGDDVRLLSLIGRDLAADQVRQALQDNGLTDRWVLPALSATPQSVILYGRDGRRMINTDLKDIQDRSYPGADADDALAGVDFTVVCNINFARPLVATVMDRGLPIATDVHAISDLNDDYNGDFMAASDILFCSHEQLPCPPATWIERVCARFGTTIVVVGLGADGALASENGAQPWHLTAVRTRPMVSSVGAGDALFASFVHHYARTGDSHGALRRAMIVASFSTGSAGAADGLPTTAEVDWWEDRLSGH